MNKIKKLSQFMRLLLQSSFFISLISLFAFIILAPFVWQHRITIPHFYSEYIDDLFFPLKISIIGNMHVLQIIIALLISIIPWVVTLTIINRLVKLFQLYEQRSIFSELNTHYLSQLSQLLLLRIFIQPVYYASISLVLSWNNPIGKHVIKVAIGSTEIGLIVLAVMILIISKIMHEATKLNDENQKFV